MNKELSNVRLTLTSDYICPWCYLGIKRLERIKKELSGEVNIEITHKPYFLYPHIPAEGSPKEAFASKTKRGMGKALKIESAKENIAINYKKISTIPNSTEAHRWTALITDPDMQWTLATALFHAYFEEGENIGISSTLEEIAIANNIPQDIIQTALNTDEGSEEVKAKVNEAKENFISVVPTVNFDGKLSVSGLQEDIMWKRYILKAAALQSK